MDELGDETDSLETQLSIEPTNGSLQASGPGAVDFGLVAVGLSKTISLTVSNRGALLTSGVLEVLASLESPFSFSDSNCSDVIEPGTSCEVIVSFSPLEAGSFSDEAVIQYWVETVERSASIQLLARSEVAVLPPPPIPPGDLDITWGSVGMASFDFGSNTTGRSSAIVVQTDGKVVLGGRYKSGTSADFALVRFLSDGLVDTGFGTLGKVIHSVSAREDTIQSLALQSDGKIVAAGSTSALGDHDIAVSRYDDVGNVDTSFGTNGIYTHRFGSFSDIAYSVAIQSDGKILISGQGRVGQYFDFFVLRLNYDGTLDSTFGTAGVVTTDIAGKNDLARAMVLQPDGRIVLAGYSRAAQYDEFAIVRYESDGSLDSSFGVNGIRMLSPGTGHDRLYGLAIQSDGKVVAVGSISAGSDTDHGIVRLDSSGAVDMSFGIQGVVRYVATMTSDILYGVVIQSDGKIVAVGIQSSPNPDVSLIRLDTDGQMDLSFGSYGNVTTALTTAADYGWGIAIQSDGKILVAADDSSSTADFVALRYEN